MKELYNKVIEAYKSKDEGSLTAAVRNWLEKETNNPFEKGSSAHSLFFSASRAFRIWKSGAISSRVSKVRMVNFVRQIAELGLPNPYENKADTEETPKKKYVFGIIPEYVPEIKTESEPAAEVKEE